MVSGFYGEMGFVKVSEDEEGNSVWELNLTDAYEPKNQVIAIEEEI